MTVRVGYANSFYCIFLYDQLIIIVWVVKHHTAKTEESAEIWWEASVVTAQLVLLVISVKDEVCYSNLKIDPLPAYVLTSC